MGDFALATFDEALTCMSFMKAIGLQGIAVAPDDKRAVMAANMDTVISVWQDVGTVSINVAYPKAKGCILLNSGAKVELSPV